MFTWEERMTAAIRTLWAPDKYDFLHTVGGYTHVPCWALYDTVPCGCPFHFSVLPFWLEGLL